MSHAAATATRTIGRLAMPATGVVGTAVFFLVVFSPNLPMYGDSLSDWGRWAPIHQSAARDAVAILLLAYLLYMVFSVYVAALVRRSDQATATLVQVATVAIAVKFAIEMMQIAVLAVPATGGSKDFSDSMAQLGSVLSVLSLVPFALFLVAIVLGLAGVSASPMLVAFGFIWFASIPAWPLVTSVALLIAALRRQGMALRVATAPAL